MRSTLLKAKMYWYVFTEAVALFSVYYRQWSLTHRVTCTETNDPTSHE